MEWREAGGTRWLEARLPGATAAFPTRSGGSLKGSHDRVAAALGIAPDQIACSRQVHGAELVFHDGAPGEAVAADGHVIRAPGVVPLVYTADCLPIALAGPGGAAILHCGWRGLAAGIVSRGVDAVGAISAAIGPGIGPCCYEVGDDVLVEFAYLGQVASGRMLDLIEVAERLLHRAGVGDIKAAGLCTACEKDLFFSHRRDGGPGRQGGLVWIDAGAS
jgi:purine-nucleoside/S-methyl-5'-thioadenosine phosphorylase / adenosine deaminase